MKQCACGSYAINPLRNGRDDTDPSSCDVCPWRHECNAMKENRDPLILVVGGHVTVRGGRYVEIEKLRAVLPQNEKEVTDE